MQAKPVATLIKATRWLNNCVGAAFELARCLQSYFKNVSAMNQNQKVDRYLCHIVIYCCYTLEQKQTFFRCFTIFSNFRFRHQHTHAYSYIHNTHTQFCYFTDLCRVLLTSASKDCVGLQRYDASEYLIVCSIYHTLIDRLLHSCILVSVDIQELCIRQLHFKLCYNHVLQFSGREEQ